MSDVMKHITKVPIDKATKPFDGALVIANRWWAEVDGCLLFYKKYSPQCNSQKEITDQILKRLYPNGRSVFIECVYVEHSCSDFY